MRTPFKSIIAGLAALAACSGELSPGPIGEPLDLRKYLPDSLRAGTTDTTFRHELVLGPDSARVELRWTRFPRGSGRYLAELNARLLAGVPYDSLKIGNPTSLVNAGSKADPVESATVNVAWFKSKGGGSGSVEFQFDANGGRRIMQTPVRP